MHLTANFYVFNEFVFLVRDKIRLAKYISSTSSCVKEFEKKNVLVFLIFKVARSSFWVTIPLNFEQLAYHSEQPNRKSIVTADLEKDESFTWGKFHRNRSYHSNVMTSPPFYMRANYLSPRDNSGKHSTGSSTWHICLHIYKIWRISMRAFSRNFWVKF